jgi:hypothetical protein
MTLRELITHIQKEAKLIRPGIEDVMKIEINNIHIFIPNETSIDVGFTNAGKLVVEDKDVK